MPIDPRTGKCDNNAESDPCNPVALAVLLASAGLSVYGAARGGSPGPQGIQGPTGPQGPEGVPFTFGVDPTVNDDSAAGYAIGDQWLKTGVPSRLWICASAAVGAAVWILSSPGSVQQLPAGGLTPNVFAAGPADPAAVNALPTFRAMTSADIPLAMILCSGTGLAAPGQIAVTRSPTGNAVAAPDRVIGGLAWAETGGFAVDVRTLVSGVDVATAITLTNQVEQLTVTDLSTYTCLFLIQLRQP